MNDRAISGSRSRRRQWTVFVPVTRRSPALQTLGSKLRSSTGLAADVFHPKAAESAEPPSSRRTQPIALSLLAGNSSRSGSRMLQRPKSLPHVMKFAQRRVELASTDEVGGLLLRIPLAAAAQDHDEQDSDSADSDESRDDDVDARAVQGYEPRIPGKRQSPALHRLVPRAYVSDSLCALPIARQVSVGRPPMVEENSCAGVLPKRPSRSASAASDDALPRQGLSSIDGRAATP